VYRRPGLVPGRCHFSEQNEGKDLASRHIGAVGLGIQADGSVPEEPPQNLAPSRHVLNQDSVEVEDALLYLVG
jgi:hypothetical protein